MISLLLLMAILGAGAESPPPEAPPVLFAPDAWSDPPNLEGFARCADVHTDAASLRTDGTRPPVIHRPKTSELTGRGRVVAEVFIDHAGRLREVRVVRAFGKEFVEKALKDLLASKFEPGTKDGEAVPVCFTVTIRSEVRR